MKKLLSIAGVLLVLFSMLFPNGIALPPLNTPVVTPDVKTDAKIVSVLSVATPEDKARVESIYTGMEYVLRRDSGKRLNTTEKWSAFQANTLQLAVEQVGKYRGLDDAIEAVFASCVGTDDVMPSTPETQQKLLEACQIIVASAQKQRDCFSGSFIVLVVQRPIVAVDCCVVVGGVVLCYHKQRFNEASANASFICF